MSEISEKLNPKGELYKQLREAIDKRFQLSKQKVSNQHDKWRRAQEQYIAYVPVTEADKLRNDARDKGKPQYTTLVLPYSYAFMMTAHSYWCTVFMSRDPVFQYAGRHGETEQQVQAVEALVGYQMLGGNMTIPMYFWLADVGIYGIGIVQDYWDKEVNSISEIVDIPQMSAFGNLPPIKQLVSKDFVTYEGSKLLNIRPFDWFPDPRVPMWDFQRGEFVGVLSEVGWNDILRRKLAGEYFNTEMLRRPDGARASAGGATAREPGATDLELPNANQGVVSYSDLKDTGPYTLLTFYFELIPSEWGLSEVKRPEKWVFTCGMNAAQTSSAQVGSVECIIGARPLGCMHNKYPMSVIISEPEAYAFSTRGMMENMRAIQQAMDWLFNSHMYAVRRATNMQLLVDPSRIIMKDIEDGSNIWRAKPAAYGTDVKGAVSQMTTMDTTTGHPNDMNFLHQFAQRAFGVPDQLSGTGPSGGRRTAQEVRADAGFGAGRQKTLSEFFSAMGFTPLGQRLVMNSQQYYQADKKFRIVGDLATMAGPAFLQVTPAMIAGAYDFIPVDGSMPIDRFAQANLWRQILADITKLPQIAMAYDLGKIFAWTAQLAGLKNINAMRIQLVPDQQAALAAQAGNVIPMPGAKPPDMTRVGEPGQLPGMGTTG